MQRIYDLDWSQRLITAIVISLAATITAERANGGWSVKISDNFACYAPDGNLAAKLSSRCETLRAAIAKRWCGPASGVSWGECPCIVVIHPTKESYTAAVGRGAEHSTGLSLTRVRERKVVVRRIDLRSDRGDPFIAALPHELTHVVLADRFLDRPMPRWADEGIAILADPTVKRLGHRQNAIAAMRGSAGAFRAGELMQLLDYPPAHRQHVFYGQSVLLAEFLVARAGEQTFVDFIDQSSSIGLEEALRTHYGFSSLDELDRVWREQLERTCESELAHELARPAHPGPSTGLTVQMNRDFQP